MKTIPQCPHLVGRPQRTRLDSGGAGNILLALLCAVLAIAASAGIAAGESGDRQPLIGKIKPRSAHEIAASNWSIGGETLDRDFAVYANYRQYLGPLGAKGIRLQAGWAKCERRPGVYDWAWLDAIVDDAVAQGLRPWLETSYGNTIYPGGGGTGLAGGLPASPAALAAWDNWVRALVRRYRDHVNEWEIWNEPDIGKGNTPEQYTALFLRTARIVRAEQPDARIYALGLAGNLSFAEQFLQRVAKENELGLVDAVTIHGYPRNPDDTSNIDRLRTILAKFDRSIEVRQGETGAPSKYQERFALSKLPWTENTQAKWNLRRMLAHHAQGVSFNLFTISDMHYTLNGQVQMNYKGLLGTHPDQTIAQVKLAYHVAQRVFAIFDDALVRETNVTCTPSVTNAIAVYAFRHRTSGAAVVALWFNDVPPVDSNEITPVDLTITGVQFTEPVYADLLTGDVFELATPENGRAFKQVALYDSPILIAEKSALPLERATLEKTAGARAGEPPGTHSVFTVKPDNTGTLLNSKPFLVVGLRLSNGLISDAKTDELIANLDTFAGYGVNTISVFFQGSRFGDVRGYREDASLDPVYAARMGRILEAADARGMVVLVGVLYHGDSKGWWKSWKQEDAEHAVANTVRWLKEHDYRNVIVDVNNEHMAKFDDERLIDAGKAVDSGYVIATSGKVTPPNADLSIHHGSPNLPDKYYIETEGTGGNYWGSYSKRKGLYDYINIGIYTDAMKAEMLKRTDEYLDRGQGYLFASTWLQNPPPGGPNHTPGGLGTADDPGVRWWLEHLKKRVGPYRYSK